MRLTLDATPQELADEGEVIRAHLEELLAGRMTLAKSQLATIKPHPVEAVNGITETWLRAYREAMAAMNDAVETLLASLVEPGKEATRGPAQP